MAVVLAEADLVWSWDQEKAKKALLTITDQVAQGKITLDNAKEIMLTAGLIQE